MDPFDENIQDYALPGSSVAAEVEAAYRRGYQQGASIAVEAIQDGAKPRDVLRWANLTLHRWRYLGQPWRKGQMVKALTPPGAPPDRDGLSVEPPWNPRP